MANKRRVYRVGEKVREIVSRELLHATDPRLNLLSITSVALSSDLGIARIYWVPIGDKSRRAEVEQALKGATSFLRNKIASALGTRFVPEIKFFYDDTLETSEQIERLMRRVESGDLESES